MLGKVEDDTFPLTAINEELRSHGQLVGFNDETAEENEAKQDQEFESWIQTRDDDFYENLVEHLIPRKSYYHQLENFDEFFEER